MFRIKIAEDLFEYKKLYFLREKFENLEDFSVIYAENYGRFKDKYDKFACHLIAKDKTDSIVGTIRVLFDTELPYGLPIKEITGRNIFFQSIEVSHFASSIKNYESLYLAFLQFIFSNCIEKRIENIYLIIPIDFHKKLQKNGFVFEKTKILNGRKSVVLINTKKCFLTLKIRNYELYLSIKNFRLEESKLNIA